MNLNYLKEFVVLAETKNYWEASERLFINQSTLSKHIKSMETELGVPLFERTTRKVNLTKFGQTLLPYAQSITTIQSEYTTALQQKRNEHQKLVTLGSISTMKQYRITDLISSYQFAYPDFRIQIVENDTAHLRNLLLKRKCELAFLLETKEDLCSEKDALVRIPHMDDSIVAIVPNSHPLAAKEAISLKDLTNEKLCLNKKNTIVYNLCCSVCQEAGFTPYIAYDFHYVGSIIDMIIKNGYVGLLMYRQVAHLFLSNRTQMLPVAMVPVEPKISAQISLCYPEDSVLSEGAAAFVDFFRVMQKQQKAHPLKPLP